MLQSNRKYSEKTLAGVLSVLSGLVFAFAFGIGGTHAQAQQGACTVENFLASESLDAFIAGLEAAGADVGGCADFLELIFIDNVFILTPEAYALMIAAAGQQTVVRSGGNTGNDVPGTIGGNGNGGNGSGQTVTTGGQGVGLDAGIKSDLSLAISQAGEALTGLADANLSTRRSTGGGRTLSSGGRLFSAAIRSGASPGTVVITGQGDGSLTATGFPVLGFTGIRLIGGGSPGTLTFEADFTNSNAAITPGIGASASAAIQPALESIYRGMLLLQARVGCGGGGCPLNSSDRVVLGAGQNATGETVGTTAIKTVVLHSFDESLAVTEAEAAATNIVAAAQALLDASAAAVAGGTTTTRTPPMGF
jgi:hypothetical protein